MQALRHWLKSDYQIVTIYTIKLSDNTNFFITDNIHKTISNMDRTDYVQYGKIIANVCFPIIDL